jgi:hypothetical protein
MFDAKLRKGNEEGFIHGGHYMCHGDCAMWQASDLAT